MHFDAMKSMLPNITANYLPVSATDWFYQCTVSDPVRATQVFDLDGYFLIKTLLSDIGKILAVVFCQTISESLRNRPISNRTLQHLQFEFSRLLNHFGALLRLILRSTLRAGSNNRIGRVAWQCFLVCSFRFLSVLVID